MKFEFNEKNHRYTLDGKPLTGVTTVLGVIAKPALIQWSANMAVDYILENGIESAEEARKAHCRKRDESAELGTDVHAECEKYVLECIANGGEAMLTPHENKQVQHFIDWATKNKVKFLESEKRVYDAELWIAGTFDGLCEIDGKKFIFDIKTSKAIWKEAFYQMGAYVMMYEKMENEKIDGTFVIRLGKDEKFNEEKDVQFRYDLETDKKAFLSALTLYRANSTFVQKR